MNKIITKYTLLLNWNFTECRAEYHRDKRKNYKFYIIDYDIPNNYKDFPTILEMRNEKVVKTRYFHTEKKALAFLYKYQSGEIK